MSLRSSQTFARSFALVAVVHLFSIGAAAAADSVDVLQQQRDLLAGRTAAVATLPNERSSADEDGHPKGESWDQENLKRNDHGCPTAIFYINPQSQQLEQCP